MPFPTKPYQKWKTADVQELIVEPRAEETLRLDFKTDYPHLLSSNKVERVKGRISLLKDISAMANAAGGALIIGVRESGKKGEEGIAETIVPVKDAERLERTISALVNQHLDIEPGESAV